MLWRCWLGGRKGIQPAKTEKLSGEVLAWLSVWSKVQMICIWSSWCHYHPIIGCSSKIPHGLPFWCRLTQVVLEKRLLNACSNSSSNCPACHPTNSKHWFHPVEWHHRFVIPYQSSEGRGTARCMIPARKVSYETSLTCPTLRQRSWAYVGSQMTILQRATSKPDLTPTSLPASVTISSTGLSSMYVPPYTALSLTTTSAKYFCNIPQL